jgi:hypothetical protein
MDDTKYVAFLTKQNWIIEHGYGGDFFHGDDKIDGK